MKVKENIMLKEPGVNYEVKSALQAILTDRPVAYHPILAKCLGSVTTALYLSQLLYWTPRADPQGWFWKTEADFTDETGLSRFNQETARAALIQSGILVAERRGLPAKLFYRVNIQELDRILMEFATRGDSQSSLRESSNQECENPAIKIAGKSQSFLTEITSENTAENTSPTPSNSQKPMDLEAPPEWLKALRDIPNWPHAAEQELIQWVASETTEDHALKTALSLLGKWDGKKWKRPVPTFKNWCLREKERRNGTVPAASPSRYPARAVRAPARRPNYEGLE